MLRLMTPEKWLTKSGKEKNRNDHIYSLILFVAGDVKYIITLRSWDRA